MVHQEGIQITESGKFHISQDGTLSIQDLGVADQGRYECIARNPFGFTSSAMQLTITGRVSPVVLLRTSSHARRGCSVLMPTL